MPGDVSRTQPDHRRGRTPILRRRPVFLTPPRRVPTSSPSTAGPGSSCGLTQSGYELGFCDHRVSSGPPRRGLSRVSPPRERRSVRRRSSARGAVIAIDVRTGKVLWKTYHWCRPTITVATPTSPATTVAMRSGRRLRSSTQRVACSIWAPETLQRARRGYARRPRKRTAHRRRPTNLRRRKIIALRLNTGAVAWADHTLSGDLWTVAQPDGTRLRLRSRTEPVHDHQSHDRR